MPTFYAFQWHGRRDQKVRLAPNLEEDRRRVDVGHHDVTLDGRVRGPLLEAGHHGQGQVPLHRVASSHQAKVR